jgi:hypothetical protein
MHVLILSANQSETGGSAALYQTANQGCRSQSLRLAQMSTFAKSVGSVSRPAGIRSPFLWSGLPYIRDVSCVSPSSSVFSMKIEGLPVIDVEESQEITVAVRADDLLEGDTSDPERTLVLAQSRHPELHRTCPLMTQSRHASINRASADAPALSEVGKHENSNTISAAPKSTS